MNTQSHTGGGRREHVRWLIELVPLLLVALLALPAAASAAKEPPFPSCFATGSGYGLCQGEVIPGGGAITKLIAPEDSKGDFDLSGPAPLQTKDPVACGDEGCVYNHLNWYVGSGVTVRKGCQPNETTCDVRVAVSLPQWSVVYVRQNNDAPTLWAIWNSGHPSHDIAGTIKARECGDTCKTVPLNGVSVTAKGPAGSGSATTGADGKYKITVPKGKNYTVTASTHGLTFKPRDRKVNVSSGNASGVDFTAEPECGTVLGTRASAASTCRLQITMAATPEKVELEADDQGKIKAKYIKVRVKIANPTDAPIGSVQLLSLQPVPVDRTQQIDQLAFDRKLFPVKFGDIEGGAAKVKTFELKVTGDGDYQVNALALFDDASRPGGNGRAVGQGGKFSVKAPLMYFTAEERGREVQEGGSWYVTGHVKNLSSFQTLCLTPLAPKWKDNAGGLGPHQIGVVPVDDPAPPLAGTLAPGKTISFLMRAQTEIGAGPTSAVELKPQATKGVPGDDCNVVQTEVRTALSGTEIKVAKDSTKFRVAVSKREILPSGAGPLEFFGGYAERSASQIAQLYESGLALAHKYGSIEALTSALGSGAYTAASKLYHAAAFSAWFWYVATPAEKEQFEGQVVNDFVVGAGKVWDGVSAQVKQTVDSYMTRLEKAYLTGDWSQLFHALGSDTAGVVNEQAVTLASWELALGLVKKAGTVATVVTRAGGEYESVLLDSLKTVPVGRILKFEEMQRLWGLAQEDYEAFKAIADKEKVLIGVRGRSPVSVKNLEEGAVWKHENLKPKNVSDIDTKYLGFHDSDTGLVAFRSYTKAEQERILEEIGKIKDPDLREIVKARAETRFGEHKYLKDIEGFNHAGEIPVDFNYADNGINIANKPGARGFALDASEVEGGTYYRPYQENPALDGLAQDKGKLPGNARKCEPRPIRNVLKVLCRVTGDMDGVYLTDLKGNALPEELRIKIYNQLAAVGWQHPETLTWIKDGLFDFAKKTDILKELQLGGQAMMEFGPEGIVRATYLNLADSKLSSVSDYFVAVLGGYTSFFTPLR